MGDYGDFIARCKRDGVEIPLGNPSCPNCVICGQLLGERRPCPKDPAKRDCSPSVEVLARESLVFDASFCEGECVTCGLPVSRDFAYGFVCPKHPGQGWCFTKKEQDAMLARRELRERQGT